MPNLDEILPHFAGATVVGWETARQDKISLKLGDWFPTTGEDRADLIHYLAGANILDYDGTELTVTGSPTGRRRNEVHLLRGGRGQVANRPALLFSGIINVGGIQTADRQSQTNARTTRINADLKLNPTRFVQHQPSIRRRGDNPLRWRFGQLRLSSGTTGQSTDSSAVGERVLVPEHDNVIIGSSSHLHHLHPGVWQRHIRNYWLGVQDVMHNIIANHPGHVRFSPNLNLLQVETYWELFHPHPMAQMVTVERRARETHAEVAATYERVLYPQYNSLFNSPCVKVRLSNSVTIKAYAKTSHRIRVEVTHRLWENARAIGGRRTTNNLDMLQEWLNMLAQDATRHVNNFLSIISSSAMQPDRLANVLDLITAIYRARQGPAADAARILEGLLSTGRWVVFPSDPLRPTALSLARSGVLHGMPGGGVTTYWVTHEYRQAFEQFREFMLADIAHRQPRQRSRRTRPAGLPSDAPDRRSR